jgi:hypothetical protein
MEKAEIIIYKESVSPDFQIEVRVEDETVWLSQLQMAELFEATKQNISLHVNNVFKDGELEPGSTVKEYLTVQFEGKREVKRKVLFYNLDVIISVGYRVKSIRGIQFRIWANKVLKEYLLRGYALNNRIDRIEQKLLEHDQKFELIINTGLKPTEGIFYDGQIFDAWQFASDLIKEAEESIILIDNYVDESVLNLLTKRKTGVSAKVFTARITKHRGRRSEVGSRKTEVRSQKSEVRGQRSEVGNRRSDVGGRIQIAIGTKVGWLAQTDNERNCKLYTHE